MIATKGVNKRLKINPCPNDVFLNTAKTPTIRL
jgi:hypothetical protein